MAEDKPWTILACGRPKGNIHIFTRFVSWGDSSSDFFSGVETDGECQKCKRKVRVRQQKSETESTICKLCFVVSTCYEHDEVMQPTQISHCETCSKEIHASGEGEKTGLTCGKCFMCFSCLDHRVSRLSTQLPTKDMFTPIDGFLLQKEGEEILRLVREAEGTQVSAPMVIFEMPTNRIKPTTLRDITRRPHLSVWQRLWRRRGAFQRRRNQRQVVHHVDDGGEEQADEQQKGDRHSDVSDEEEEDTAPDYWSCQQCSHPNPISTKSCASCGCEKSGSQQGGSDSHVTQDSEDGDQDDIGEEHEELFEFDDTTFETGLDRFLRDTRAVRDTNNRNGNDGESNNDDSSDEFSNESARRERRNQQKKDGEEEQESEDEDFVFERMTTNVSHLTPNDHTDRLRSVYELFYMIQAYYARVTVLNLMQDMVTNDTICDPSVVSSCISACGTSCVEMRDDSPGPRLGSYVESHLLKNAFSIMMAHYEANPFIQRVFRCILLDVISQLQLRGSNVVMYSAGINDFAAAIVPSGEKSDVTFLLLTDDIEAMEHTKVYSGYPNSSLVELLSGRDCFNSFTAESIVLHIPPLGRHVEIAVRMGTSQSEEESDMSVGQTAMCLEFLESILQFPKSHPAVQSILRPYVTQVLLKNVGSADRQPVERLRSLCTLTRIIQVANTKDVFPPQALVDKFFSAVTQRITDETYDVIHSKFVQESIRFVLALEAVDPSYVQASSAPVINKIVLQFKAYREVARCLVDSKPLPTFMERSAGDAIPGRHGPEEISLISCWHSQIDSDEMTAENDGSPNGIAIVKTNVCVSSGMWYYEAVFDDVSSLDRIGWAVKGYTGENGTLLGDDKCSYAVNFRERIKLHNGEASPYGANMDAVSEGDVIGCLFDGERRSLSFFINGASRGPAFENIKIDPNLLYFPCATFEQAIRFSFGGSHPVMFPPENASTLTIRTALSEEKIAAYFAAPERTYMKPMPPDFWTQLCGYVNAQTTKQNLDADEIEVTWDLQDVTPFPLMTAMVTSDPQGLTRALHILLYFNTLTNDVIKYIDFDNPSELTQLHLQSKRYMVYTSRLNTTMQKLISDSEQFSACPIVQLNRYKADRTATFRDSIFFQLFRHLVDVSHGKPEMFFQTDGAWYSVVFMGEGSTDQGGPFRETITEIAQELQAPPGILPLFIPTANHRVNIGIDRELYYPNPKASDPLSRAMYIFLGMIMGGCMRSSETLAIALPRLFWRLLAYETVTIDDLIQVDSSAVTTLRGFASLRELGVTPEMFADTMSDQNFVTTGMDGAEIELCLNGKDKSVTWDTLEEYIKLATQARLSESKQQIDWIRLGMLRIVPPELLRMPNARMVEGFVAGRPEISYEALKQCTQYSAGLHESDPVVQQFWQVVKDMTNSDRQALLRFTSGRSRLPATLELGRYLPPEGNPDDHLPVSHTCFFQLELPQYSSVDVMRTKLLYAIHNCHAIDMDFNPHGFEEEENSW